MTTEINAAAEFDFMENLPVSNPYSNTFYLTYEEVEEALIDWLRKSDNLDATEVVLGTDIPISLTEDDESGDLVFKFDLETAYYEAGS